MKILVVDDDPIIRELLRKTMQVSGFDDVTLAESAVEAAPMVSEADPPFECLFVDIRMPEVDGSYLCKWIRKQPGYDKTPIIMITALSGKGDIDRSFAAGASDYITKPIDPSRLSFQLKLIARERRRQQAPQPAERPLSDGSADDPGANRIDFRTPFRVGGFDRELDLSTLENYLKTLSRTGLHEVSAFSFVIQDALKLHLILPDEDFISILRDTGVALSEFLPKKDLFLAYAGYGAFVGVAQDWMVDETAREKLETAVQTFLDGLRIVLEDGTEMGVKPFMSLPNRLAGLPDQNAVDVLYRLIGEAEERTGSKIGLPAENGA